MLRRVRWVQDHGFVLSDETLGAFRLLYFGLVLASWRPGTLTWVTDYPVWLRNPPPGLTELTVHTPPVAVLIGIELAIGLSALLAFLGVRTRWASSCFALLTVVHHSYQFSFGKIDHDLPSVSIALIFAFSGWGNRFGLLGRTWESPQTTASGSINSRAVSVQFALVGVAFFTAGLAKLRGSWLGPTRQSARDWVAYYQSITDGQPPLADLALQMPTPVWEAIDLATVALEMGLLIFLFIPRFRKLAILLLIFFHLGVLVTMGIDFGAFLFVYIPFVATTHAGDRLGRWWQGRGRWAGPLALGIVAGYRLFNTFVLPELRDGPGTFYLPNLVRFGLAIVLLMWFARATEPVPDGAGTGDPDPIGPDMELVRKPVLHDCGEVVGVQ